MTHWTRIASLLLRRMEEGCWEALTYVDQLNQGMRVFTRSDIPLLFGSTYQDEHPLETDCPATARLVSLLKGAR